MVEVHHTPKVDNFLNTSLTSLTTQDYVDSDSGCHLVSPEPLPDYDDDEKLSVSGQGSLFMVGRDQSSPSNHSQASSFKDDSTNLRNEFDDISIEQLNEEDAGENLSKKDIDIAPKLTFIPLPPPLPFVASTPPPPPPPPPLPLSASSSQSSRSGLTSQRPQLKILEETRLQNETHAALMRAVQKRREQLDNLDMSIVTENIESQVNKANCVNTTLYKTDKSKQLIKTPPPLTRSDKTPPPLTRSDKTPPYLTGSVRSLVGSPPRVDAVNHMNGSESNSNSSINGSELSNADIKTSQSDCSKSLGTNADKVEDIGYTLAAEKALQDYLLKQTTLKSAKKDQQTIKSNLLNSAEFAQRVAQRAQRSGGDSEKQDGLKVVDDMGQNQTISSDENNEKFQETNNSQSNSGNKTIYPSNNVQPIIKSQQQGKGDKSPGGSVLSGRLAIGPAVPRKTNLIKVNGSVDSLPNKSCHPLNGLVRQGQGVKVTGGVNSTSPDILSFDDNSPENSSTIQKANKKTNSTTFNAKPVRSATGNESIGDATHDGKTDAGPRGKIDQWSVDDVCDWLEGLDYEAYRETFREQEINGSKLMKLGQQDMTLLGVTNALHQVVLVREIEKLNKTDSLS